jgi:hypothetical protein
MCTVQAPHCAGPQPNLVPCRPMASRIATGMSAGVPSRSSGVQIGGRKPSICELGGLPLGRHVLNQPALPKPEWEAEVDKMRTAFKAPIDAKDVGAILDSLVSIKGVN